MDVVFMGTPDFAVPSLEALAAAFNVAAVVTRPDAVRGRGKTLVPSPVKEAATRLGLPVIEARKMTDDVVARLTELAPDVIAVAAFGAILPQRVLDIPKLACVNVHASLLPRWRGAAPIQRAILAGDAEAGVSIMEVVKDLDAGDYCLTGSVPIAGKSTAEVTDELSHIGAALLVDALGALERGELTWQAQDESQVTYAAKIEKAEMRLDPADAADLNWRRVLASSDAAPARLVVAGRPMRALAAKLSDVEVPEGAVVIENGAVLLGCSEGTLELVEVKPDGKRAMAAADWAKGVHGTDGLAWGRD